MSKPDDELLKHLMPAFIEEASELLGMLSSGLTDLEHENSDERRAQILEAAARQTHSLKGGAGTLDLQEAVAVCQSFEDVLKVLRALEHPPSGAVYDILLGAVDFLQELVESAATERTTDQKMTADKIVLDLKKAASEKAPPVGPQERAQPAPRMPDAKPTLGAETIRISTNRLDTILYQTEELISAKLAIEQRSIEAGEAAASFFAWLKTWTDSANGQDEDTSSFFAGFAARQGHLSKHLAADSRNLSEEIDRLLDDVKKTLLLPFSFLLRTYPRLVRDLARSQEKEIELLVEGAEIEVDKRIMEEMQDALTHLVRNAVDHGIDDPKTRASRGKPRRGRIKISVSEKDGSLVEVTIADDGDGLDLQKLKEKAIERGDISAEAARKLTEHDLESLVWRSGISTSAVVSEISGRGLGMTIVRDRVENLGGSAHIESEPGVGATFRLTLPLTMATFRGIRVGVEGREYFISTAHVHRVLRVDPAGIGLVENRRTLELDGEPSALVRLQELLGLPAEGSRLPANRATHAVVLLSGEQKVVCEVDTVIAEEQVLAKGLGPQLKRVRHFSGATLVGSGQVIPILNVPDLLKTAIGQGQVGEALWAADDAGGARAVDTQREAILLVEDSRVTRAFLRGVLEADNYEVVEAQDGMAALEALGNRRFDAVVSDVDMPRLDGFELTRKIRADKVHSHIPVVLVTALASAADKTAGNEAGASAYLVKSGFEQHELTETIQSLLHA